MSVRISKYYCDFLSRLEMPQELLRQLRRADDFIRLGVFAGYQSIRPAQEIDALPAESRGLILGTAFGPMETNFEVLDQVITDQPASPILFSHSVFNATAGYMAISLGIKGCALTVTDFAFPFFRALEQGYLAIISGRLESCLVLQVETYSKLLQDGKNINGSEKTLWEPGVVCWLLEKADDENSQHYCIESFNVESLSIESKNNESREYLCVQEQMTINSMNVVATDPLGSAVFITREIEKQQDEPCLDCRIEAPYGTVSLYLQK
ncbi:MAG: hypothetical protein GY799_28420 [Desulfobulbaceae bacterium]|nr:hypothetical protein [Desulfobulbaceae bacterium]